MAVSNQLRNQHLLWRAAFGPMAENAAALEKMPQSELWTLLKKTSAAQPAKIVVQTTATDYAADLMKVSAMTEEEKRAAQRLRRVENKNALAKLNLLWMHEMVNSKAQLREKMSLFWHGHFACKVLNSYFSQELLHTIRTHALGSFETLLTEVSKSPAMLQFLNNQQNRKGRPNENFAREVMELFTMGRGNYTEQDIKEAARAFTGWGYDGKGEFVFRKNQHDDGVKTFLGQTGNFTGEDILQILLKQPATVEYISKKIYRFFVHENAPEERVKSLASTFKKSNYNITALLDAIYSSKWFYQEENIGSKIKSPVELMCGLRRMLPLTLNNDAALLLFQKVLGQVLFYPPNVAGWPGGNTWIDSSTLMVRLQLPQVLAAKENISLSPKNDDDVNMGMVNDAAVQKIGKQKAAQDAAGAVIDWTPVYKIFEQVKRENLSRQIQSVLWQLPPKAFNDAFAKYADATTRESFIKSMSIALMSTPEYQMC